MSAKLTGYIKNNITVRKIIFCLFVCVYAFAVVYPMKLSPMWNGMIPEHRNQYELQAEAFINGHLYLDVEVSDELKAMENPYDNVARAENGVPFKWDHAYYREHYYMYFGVVPVLLVFLPFRLISGKTLTTYHATQFFTFGIIISFFYLFYYLRKRFFKKMPFSAYVILSVSLSATSVWYFVAAPAMYCTAISSAICLMMISLIFFFRVAFDDLTDKKRILYCVLGSLSGALTFGCRPTVALANIALIPLFVLLLKKNSDKKMLIKTVTSIVLPYVIVAILLAGYNYLRFDNPLEFGQAYQLTEADQHEYGLLSDIDVTDTVNGFIELFFHSEALDDFFPFVRFGGIFFEFPIFLIGLGCVLFSEGVKNVLKENKLTGVFVFIVLSLLISVMVMLNMSPMINERYKTDYLFLLSVLLFMTFGSWLNCGSGSLLKIRKVTVAVLSVITLLTAVLLFLYPDDYNYTYMYPEVLDKIRGLLGI